MKKLFTQWIKAIPILLMVLSFAVTNAQNFTLSVQNQTQTAPNKLDFDVYLLNTNSAQPFELATIQLGFQFNSNIYTGGTVTATINNAGSGLKASQQFVQSPNNVVSVLTGYPNQTLIRQAGKTPPGTGAGTIISTIAPGTLVTHFTITSTVNFTPNSTPNLTFTSTSSTSPLYATSISEYITNVNTLLTVTAGTNAIVIGIPVLNSAPTAFAVTGGGSYCQGGAGLPVGLANSETGVTYTLFKNTVPQVPTVPGLTGSAITFGNQLAGTYTVSGTHFSITTSMTGSAVITAQAAPNAGTSGFLTICAGSTVTAAQLAAVIGTHDAGGAWTPVLAGAGIYTYTVSATAPCTLAAIATVTVTAQAAPNAGTSGFLTICAESTVTAAQLAAVIGTHDAGGVWTPVLAGAGIYTYTVTASAPCIGSATATVTVSEQAVPNAGTSGLLTICAGSTVTTADLFTAIGTHDASGVWTPALAGAGIYTYTVTATAPCIGSATATVTVIIVAPALADAPANVINCGPYILPILTNGNYFTSKGGVGPLSAGDVLSISTTLYVFAAGTAPCPDVENSFTVTITIAPLADAPAPVSASDSYTLPALTNGNYFTGAGGTGTALSAGAVISSTQTLYVYTPATGSCAAAENRFVITITTSPLAAFVSINLSQNNVCAGIPVTFTAIPVNGGISPTYVWYLNNKAAATGAGGTYIPTNGDVIYVVMTSSLPLVTGRPATSNSVTMVVNQAPVGTVSITSSANNVSPGTPVTFTATSVGGGTSPTYTWYLNNVAVTTGSSGTYVPTNGDIVYANMTSSLTCAAGSIATSNSITMVVSQGGIASVSISASQNNVCAGTPVIFTATPINGGTSPTYQWFKNNLAIATGSSGTYIPANGDVIYVVMTSNLPLATGSPAKSNVVTMVVNAAPAQPAYFIQGMANVTPGMSNVRYTVPSVAAVTYIWSYSGTGVTIAGITNSVLISFSGIATSGTLSVIASNGCGISTPRSGVITVGTTLKAGIISNVLEPVNKNATQAKNELKVYPNPSTGPVTFEFRINENAKVSLDVFGLSGKRIARIFDADVESDVTQTVHFDESLPSGVYVYVLKWNDQVITGKLIRNK